MSVKIRCGSNQGSREGYRIVEKKCPERNECKTTNPCTEVSVLNPQTELIIPELTSGGFSMQHVVGGFVDLARWQRSLSIDAIGSFNLNTGTYTAAVSGDYVIRAVISYECSVPLSTDTSLSAVPYVELYDVADPTGHLLTGHLPASSQIITIPPTTSGEFPIEVESAFIQSKGQVYLSGILTLQAGQQIRLRAVTGGLTYTAPLGLQAINSSLPPRIVFFTPFSDSTFSIYRYRNTPSIYISCNN